MSSPHGPAIIAQAERKSTGFAPVDTARAAGVAFCLMAPGSEHSLLEFQRRVDDAIEHVQRERLGLSQLMERILPLLRDQLGASTAFVRTLAEDLEAADFQSPSDSPLDDALLAQLETAAGAAPVVDQTEATAAGHSARVVAQALDVAGEQFGVVGVAWIGGDDRAVADIHPWLDAFAEELDNQLAAIRLARIKQRVLVTIGHALKDPLLGRGIEQAVLALQQQIGFDQLFLSYRHEDRYAEERVYHKVFDARHLVYDSRNGEAASHDALAPELRDAVEAWTGTDPAGAAELLGPRAQLQETLIYGIREEVQLGRILLVSATKDVSSTFNRDLMELFANAICQRIVDYSKESRFLHQFFSAPHTDRMLADEDYRAKYLTPRSADVAILYTDISGFTRLSEQHLQDPELIGAFVDHWSRGAVDILWRHGGVFDKLVGDCIIGLFGPPFYELSAEQMCTSTARTAIELREFTRTMAAGPLGETFPILAELGSAIGVATGINLAPANVGLFGPNNDFTAFSSGMNNTARLQGVATRDEILVMEPMAEQLAAAGFELGDTLSADVKNVAEPLRYRKLLD